MSGQNLTAERAKGSMGGVVLFLFFLMFTTSTAQSAQVTLAWNRHDDSRVVGYNVYHGSSSGEYTDTADAGNETRYTVTGLEEGKTYYFVVTAYDAAGSESDPSEEVQQTVKVSSNEAGGAGGDSGGDSGGGGGGCFIATAAFGSPLAPEVQTLRAFRDTYLLTNVAGRTFVRVYYLVSPSLANQLQQHDTLRALARALLLPLFYGAKHPQAIPVVMCSMLVLAALAFRRVLRCGLRATCAARLPHHR